MSTFPILPLFTDTFIADTGHLSGQETGAYLLLLMMAWRSPECRLPDANEKLARWARVDKRTWLRIKPDVMAFWTLTDGFWTQKRLRKEWDFVSKRAEVNRRNGQQGGRAKSLSDNETVKRLGSPRDSEIKAPIPIPIASPTGEAAGATSDPKSVKAFIDRMLSRFPEFGAQAARSPALLSPAAINLWVSKGYDLALDVEPAVVGILERPRARPPGGWTYFENAVIEQNAKRIALPNAGAPAVPKTSMQNPDGSRKPDRDGVVRVRKVHSTGGGADFLPPDDDGMPSHWRAKLAAFQRGVPWPEEDLGPAPGHPACLVPARILEPFLRPPMPQDGTGSTARH